MSIASLLETFAGRLLYKVRGRDAKLFIKTAPFAAHPTPTITVQSPDYVPTTFAGNETDAVTPVILRVEHTQMGSDHFPSLSWIVPEGLISEIQSWAVIVEDPDAPLPTPVVHGLYYGLPVTKTELNQRDMELLGASVKGGQTAEFRYGRNRRKTVWAGPKPVMGHGSHRYFFQIVGLLDIQWDDSEILTKERLVDAIEGKVVAWGFWVGTFERR